MKQFIDNYFDTTYEIMYPKLIAYVVTKCNDIHYVEDIVQEVFIEYYGMLCRKGVAYVKNTEAVLIKIAKTRVYRYYTFKEKLKRVLPLTKKNDQHEEVENFNIVYENVEEKYINSQTINEIWQIIKTTSLIIQKIFILHYYADKTIKEIAMDLKLTESDVKHKLYRTINKIREKYKT